MKVLVDVKNLALYRGGIAHWFSPLISSWILQRPNLHFVLIGPELDLGFLPDTNNWEHRKLAWPEWLPRPLRHPCYDNILFPLAVRKISPDRIMSPYHDVRMPDNIPSAICVHDLCFDELTNIYPRHIRSYYLNLLRRNLRRASSVVTVSETTRNKLSERYGVSVDKISVVYNTLPDTFNEPIDSREVQSFKDRYASGGALLFYAGGSEYRKNVHNLARAFAIYLKGNPRARLLVTGASNQRWATIFAELPQEVSAAVIFAGKLTDHELHVAYRAADAVVYPSLCEGFGRVCLEAMGTGTPLACSNLPVMHEVSGQYARYFDPQDPSSIANSLQAALAEGKKPTFIDQRFERASVEDVFLKAMDQFVNT